MTSRTHSTPQHFILLHRDFRKYVNSVPTHPTPRPNAVNTHVPFLSMKSGLGHATSFAVIRHSTGQEIVLIVVKRQIKQN